MDTFSNKFYQQEYIFLTLIISNFMAQFILRKLGQRTATLTNIIVSILTGQLDQMQTSLY